MGITKRGKNLMGSFQKSAKDFHIKKLMGQKLLNGDMYFNKLIKYPFLENLFDGKLLNAEMWCLDKQSLGMLKNKKAKNY